MRAHRHIQCLEARRLLSSDPFIVYADDADNIIQVSVSAWSVGMTVDGNTESYQFDEPITGIVVHGGAGNDKIDVVAHDVDVSVHGDAGNDDILIHDVQHTGYYFGDDGDDNFRVYRSSWTQRIFSGGGGTDTVDFAGFINEWFPVTVSFDNVANDGSPTEFNGILSVPGPDNVLDDVERILGTPGPDTIVGSDNDEIFITRGGHDQINGGGGDDLIQAGAGNDTLAGGDGADTLNAGSGDDSIDSDSSDTVIDPADAFISEGELIVNGTAEDDLIELTYDSTDDAIEVNVNGQVTAADSRAVSHIRIVAGGGDDYIRSEVGLESTILGDDTLSAGGDDTIISGWSNDMIYGGGGNDFLMGRGGFDSIWGQSGDDTLVGGAQDDKLDGGDGDNMLIDGDADVPPEPVVPPEPAPLEPPLPQPLPPQPQLPHPVLRKNALRITATAGDDEIVLRRRASRPKMIEVLVNGAATSYRFADIKQIVIDAGAGNDEIAFDATLKTARFTTRLFGGAGSDAITGSINADRICGGDGNDTINSGGGNDSLYGEAGNDRLYGGAGADYLCAGAGKDILRGGADRDRLAVISPKRTDLRDNKGDRIVLSLL